MLQRLLRGPAAPLLGATWTGTTPLVMLPNDSIDGRETCWTPFPKEDPPKHSRSQDSIRPGLTASGVGSVGRRAPRVVNVIRTWQREHELLKD